MYKIFIILSCQHPCPLDRKVLLQLIGILGLSCMLDVLVDERAECVVESLSSSIL